MFELPEYWSQVRKPDSARAGVTRRRKRAAGDTVGGGTGSTVLTASGS